MSSGYIDIPVSGGGPGAGVSSLNSMFGALTLLAGSGISIAATGAQELTITNTAGIVFPILAPDGDSVNPSYSFASDTDSGIFKNGDGNLSFTANAATRLTIDPGIVAITGDLNIAGDITANNFPLTGIANAFAAFDPSGDLYSAPGFSINSFSGGIDENITADVNNIAGNTNLNSTNLNLAILQDSPSDSWIAEFHQVNIDSTSSGFQFGSNGTALTMLNHQLNHTGISDIGGLSFINNNFTIGNGTDPIEFNGLSYSYGFGAVADNVTLAGPMQGYGFQFNVAAGATMGPFSSIRAFYDNVNINCAATNYSSYSAGPNIESMQNNCGYQGLQIGPNIDAFTGNSGATLVNLGGTFGDLDTGGFTAINVNSTIGEFTNGGGFNGLAIQPNIAMNNSYSVGLNIDMSNVTNYAGTASTLVVQDITYTVNAVGNNNAVTVEYRDTVTAGNEVAVFNNPHIVVSIQSGVSTATQVKVALDADPTISTSLATTITGTAGNAQVMQAETNLAGGTNPGQSPAARFVGDVSIDGALNFTGSLSIGALSAFAQKDLSTLVAGVNSIDQLITSPFLDDNMSISGSDLLGINTAMLLTLGDNATITTNFLGIAALGLPAVVDMGAGASVDLISGAVFALSLGGTGGGTIDEVNLCRALSIPNGVTTVTKLKGYAFDLPFGDPGVTTWGVYIEPACNNYMAGNLKIGTGADVATTSKALDVVGDVLVTGEMNASTVIAGNGATGTFTTVDLKTVTVTNGIITSIV